MSCWQQRPAVGGGGLVGRLSLAWWAVVALLPSLVRLAFFIQFLLLSSLSMCSFWCGFAGAAAAGTLKCTQRLLAAMPARPQPRTSGLTGQCPPCLGCWRLRRAWQRTPLHQCLRRLQQAYSIISQSRARPCPLTPKCLGLQCGMLVCSNTSAAVLHVAALTSLHHR